MTSLFITGGTGFIGRHVLALLRELPVDDVRCLVRRQGTARGLVAWRSEWVEVVGDVGRPEQYAQALPADATVVHLAAATGKRRPRELHQQNVDATAALVHAAEAAGVGRLVFISSVAARFPDLTRYPYGASKRDAERIVEAGRLPHAIIRPTMVFGDGSANQQALERLALLPVPIMFGTGSVLVQPVAARDLARVIVGIATQGRTGETFEVGGPETRSLDALFAEIRRYRGATARRPLHLPVAPIRRALSLMEPWLFPILPFTAGQLAAFVSESCASRAGGDLGTLAPTTGVREMLVGGREAGA